MNDFDWLTHLTVLILACFAGTVDFVTSVKNEWGQHSMPFLLFSFFARLLSAGFAGLLMFWLLQASSDDGVVILSGYSAFSVAISGFLGDQAIKIFANLWGRAHK